jgi:hypothetical protein
LLRLELLELSLLPLDLSLLCRQLPLHVCFLLLPRLELVANESAAEEADGGTDAGACPSVTRCAADDGS